MSMGVITDDSKPYDIESNLMYSFPVTIGPDRQVHTRSLKNRFKKKILEP